MRKIWLLAGTVLLAQPSASFAQGQGHGGHNNFGSDRATQAEQQDNQRSNNGNRGNSERNQRAEPRNNDSGQDNPRDQSDRSQTRDPGIRSERVVTDNLRGSVSGEARRVSERAVRTVVAGRYSGRDRGFDGCPPGLQQKDNGCLPPGQARKLSNSADRDMRWYRYSDWYQAGGNTDWRYDRGYAYLVDPRTNLIATALPLVGGALFGGNSWPANYLDSQLTPYQSRFYGSDQALDYRYADGAIFAVNPQDQMIQSIAGLLTGDIWTIGSPMPSGYGAYNVPNAYRDRYTDNSSSLYRYNDGYVYEVDPTTQIVRSLIELVA